MTVEISKGEAMGALEDGHSIWSKEYAEAICKALDVDASDLPAYKAYTDTSQANPKYNTYMSKDMEGTVSVDAESLGPYVADKLGIEGVPFFSGRGFQARAYARAIREVIESR